MASKLTEISHTVFLCAHRALGREVHKAPLRERLPPSIMSSLLFFCLRFFWPRPLADRAP